MPPLPERVRIAPFDPAIHDRSTFNSGVVQVDNFLQRSVSKLTKADNIRLFVMTDAAELIGFYAVNVHAIDLSELPAHFRRKSPRHRNIPAGYIAMMGIDQRHQNRGLGRSLLLHALFHLEFVSRHVGMAVVLLDVLDCGDPPSVARRKALYIGQGFQPLASNPMRLYLPIAAVRQLREAP